MPPLSHALPIAVQAINARLTRRPRLAQASLYITHRCNLRCVYCGSPYMKTPELTTDQWREIVRELSRLGCRRILILGGEPLVRKDVGEIIEAVKKSGMSCLLTSNGLLVPRHLESLKTLDTLVLSLDAVGAGNDKVRGRGVSDAVATAIAAAQKAGIPVKLNAVMTRESAPHLEELLRFAEEMDVSVTVNVVRTGNDALWYAAASVDQSQDDTRRLLLKLARSASENPRVLFSERTYRFAATWPDYARDRMEAGEVGNHELSDAPECHAGRAYVSFGPDGSTYPCALTAGSIAGGNAISDGVEAAWRGLFDHDCKYCYSPCTVEQNYLYSLQPKVLMQFVRKHMPRYS